ncbi:uncharacterized protein LOC118424385 [Branchiostoma floridae]|uniref:Uncharacterized protein LOC118424385 n=1 Tax=Branchiostoma floridae TaxID=7739 RepID=A0A9J7LTK9_BRAFL|nr:uncharacterized protein LOC118424385 [Branchiostoma floridae]
MERSLRDGTDPDEGEICRVDPAFPNKSKLSRTGRVQKWREIKSKLVLGEDFVAHCDTPNHRLPARKDIERIFQDSHLTAHPESAIHQSWRETWKSISSVYQTNVKKFGITRVVPSSTQNTDSQTTNRKTTRQPDKQAKHRKKIKQTHKCIVLPGEHHGKFKRARCDNCGTSNYVCVSGKATEASTTCKNCDEEVTWVSPKNGHR